MQKSLKITLNDRTEYFIQLTNSRFLLLNSIQNTSNKTSFARRDKINTENIQSVHFLSVQLEIVGYGTIWGNQMFSNNNLSVRKYNIVSLPVRLILWKSERKKKKKHFRWPWIFKNIIIASRMKYRMKTNTYAKGCESLFKAFNHRIHSLVSRVVSLSCLCNIVCKQTSEYFRIECIFIKCDGLYTNDRNVPTPRQSLTIYYYIIIFVVAFITTLITSKKKKMTIYNISNDVSCGGMFSLRINQSNII